MSNTSTATQSLLSDAFKTVRSGENSLHELYVLKRTLLGRTGVVRQLRDSYYAQLKTEKRGSEGQKILKGKLSRLSVMAKDLRDAITTEMNKIRFNRAAKKDNTSQNRIEFLKGKIVKNFDELWELDHDTVKQLLSDLSLIVSTYSSDES